MTEITPVFLRPIQIATLLGVSKPHAQNMIKAGIFRGIKLSPMVMVVLKSEVDAYIAEKVQL